MNDEDQFDFTKSKRGLGEIYEEDYRKKLVANEDPNAFLHGTELLSGIDSNLKKELQDLMKGLFN